MIGGISNAAMLAAQAVFKADRLIFMLIAPV
jgi:hypothetical protein